MDFYIVNVRVGELVGFLIIKHETILVDELRNRDFPQWRRQILQNVLVDPRLSRK